MSEDADDDKKLPAIQNRLIGAAVEIDPDDPLGIVYQAISAQPLEKVKLAQHPASFVA